MSWYSLLFFSKIADSFVEVFAKKILRNPKVNPTSFTLSAQFVAGLLVFVIGVFLPNFGLLPGATFPWFNVFLMMVFYGFGSVFYMKAISQTELSKIAIIISTTTVFTIITSAIFLGESLTLNQMLGGLIIISGVIVVSLEKMKFTFGKGELLAIISAAMFGIQTTNDKFILGNLGVYFYLFLAFTLPPLLTGLFYRKEVTQSKSTIKAIGYNKYFIYCFLSFAQAILFFIALNQTTSSLLVIFNLAGRILTVLMCMVFLKERDNLLQKLLGSIAVIAGLYILS